MNTTSHPTAQELVAVLFWQLAQHSMPSTAIGRTFSGKRLYAEIAAQRKKQPELLASLSLMTLRSDSIKRICQHSLYRPLSAIIYFLFEPELNHAHLYVINKVTLGELYEQARTDHASYLAGNFLTIARFLFLLESALIERHEKEGY